MAEMTLRQERREARRAAKRAPKHKLTPRKLAARILQYLVLALIALYLIFPYIFMLNRSFMYPADIMTLPVKFFPPKLTLDGWVKMFEQNNYLLYTFNTLKIVCFNMIAVPLSASVCAYGFTKIRFPGRDFVFSATLATIMIPGAVTQVPLYIMFSRLGWVNGALCMTIPALFGGGAVTIFLFMQFMRGISFELENAAKIDGANVFQRYALITMPLCWPIILYTVISTFSGGWSDFYGPLVYLKSREQYTLALVIYYDSINTNVAMEVANVRMAAGVFMSLPPLILFFLYQKNLIEGIQVGAIKG